jgi:hypothetical protein
MKLPHIFYFTKNIKKNRKTITKRKRKNKEKVIEKDKGKTISDLKRHVNGYK